MIFNHFYKGKQLLYLPACFCVQCSPFKIGSTLNLIALRKAEIVYNFGLSESNRVKGKNLLLGEQIFSLTVDP